MKSSFSLSALAQVFKQSSFTARHRIIGMYAFLVGFNVLSWIAALLVFTRSPSLLLLALTAYTFGLRHAFDADHISAIDNVTRKLMQEKKQPVAVGFFFSLGHSTVVVLLTILIAGAAVAVASFDVLKNIGGLIGTSVSALFLLLIALINIVILVDIFKTFRSVRRGEAYNDLTLNESLNNRGLLARIFLPILRTTDQSWKMYPVGFLFGLGFDTATEIGLLAVCRRDTGDLPLVMVSCVYEKNLQNREL